MNIDINDMILEIGRAATHDSDYRGKLISELPDVVTNSAAELKHRFDAALTDVLDPKYRTLIERLMRTLEELESQINESANAHDEEEGAHNGRISAIEAVLETKEPGIITGTMPITRGGTGADTPEGAREALGAAGEDELELLRARLEEETAVTDVSSLFSITAGTNCQGGSIYSAHKTGNVVQIVIQLTAASALTAGKDINATLNAPAYLLPVTSNRGIGYNGSTAVTCALENTGSLHWRLHGSISAGSGIYTAYTYISAG